MTAAGTRIRTVAVIPVYNHGDTVAAVAAALHARGLPVILVDDGSDLPLTDGAAQHLPPERTTLLRLPENRGKGAAVMAGFRHAHEQGYSHVVQIDADGQHDLDALPAFLAAAARRPEAVINGCPRYDTSVPRARLYGRYLTHVWVWINTLSLRIPDSMCGFRVYPLAAVMPLLPALAHAQRMDFDPEILVRLDWQGAPIVNLPVSVRYPADGRSHFRPWRDNLRLAAMQTRLFFGMLRRFPKLLLRLARGGKS